MRLATVQVAICLSLAPAVLNGQLFLIAGTPQTNEFNAAYASDLLQVGPNGVTVVASLLPANLATGKVHISYDWRKVVIVSALPNDYAAVLDFDEARIIKACKLPSDPGFGLVEQWLADIPGTGPVLALLGATTTRPPYSAIKRMSLDPRVPCGLSFTDGQPLDLIRIVAHGFGGAADIVPSDGTSGAINAEGVMTRHLMNTDISFGFEIPSQLRQAPPNNSAALIVNDSHALVLGVGGGDAYRALLLRKADKTWHALPQCCDVTGFGQFIAITEVLTKAVDSKPGTASRGDKAATAQPLAESAGKSEWRSKESRRGPDMTIRFENSRNRGAIYPGRLHAYNIDTEKLYTITTNQGDSEIVLIEDNAVYYRVSDRLYKAPITDSGIGAATLMATDEAIRDAHWAFIKH
jgi:hypothetical protein